MPAAPAARASQPRASSRQRFCVWRYAATHSFPTPGDDEQGQRVARSLREERGQSCGVCLNGFLSADACVADTRVRGAADTRVRGGRDHRIATMAKANEATTAQENWAEHERTYRGFVKGVVIFTAHVFVILLILAWVFAGSFNAPPAT